MSIDAVTLEVARNHFAGIAEEMGVVRRRTSSMRTYEMKYQTPMMSPNMTIGATMCSSRSRRLARAASRALSPTATKARPGGSINAFCEAATVTSTPQSLAAR